MSDTLVFFLLNAGAGAAVIAAELLVLVALHGAEGLVTAGAEPLEFDSGKPIALCGGCGAPVFWRDPMQSAVERTCACVEEGIAGG